jgi:hypothetical protein
LFSPTTACLFGVLSISAASLFGRLASSAIQFGTIMLASR